MVFSLDDYLPWSFVQVSLSAFAFLFSELVQYNQGKVENIAELEHRSEFSALVKTFRVLHAKSLMPYLLIIVWVVKSHSVSLPHGLSASNVRAEIVFFPTLRVDNIFFCPCDN